MKDRSKIKTIIVATVIIAFIFLLLLFVSFYKRRVNVFKYTQAEQLMQERQYESALAIFSQIPNFRDVSLKIEEAQKGCIYNEACTLMKSGKNEEALAKFISVKDINDSEEKIKEIKYSMAVEYYHAENYEKAKLIFDEIKDYRDTNDYIDRITVLSVSKAEERIYKKANELFSNGEYTAAIEEFELIINYKDSRKMREKCLGKIYEKAMQLFNNEEFAEAANSFVYLDSFKDSQDFLVECDKQIQRRNLHNTIFVGIYCCGAISKNGGKVYCAGKNFFGQLDTEKWAKMVSIDGYNTLTIGIDENKNAFVAGKYDLTHNWEDGKIVDYSEWKGIKDVAAGEQFVIALKDDGKVLFGGLDEYDCKKEVEEWEKIIAIEAGFDFAVGLTQDSELVFAGRAQKLKEDYLKDKDKWKNIVNIAASGGNSESNYITYGHVVGLKENGDVIALGDNNYGQCNVSDWSGISKIVAGDWFTVGLTANETLMITGRDVQDIKGIEFDKVDRCTGVKDLGAGFGATIYVDKDGKYDAFGFKENGWPELLEKLNN